MENKWRAARYGLDGKLIDFGKQKEVPARDLVHEYLDFIDDVVDELDSRQELEYIHKIVDGGSGADRAQQYPTRPRSGNGVAREAIYARDPHVLHEDESLSDFAGRFDEAEERVFALFAAGIQRSDEQGRREVAAHLCRAVGSAHREHETAAADTDQRRGLRGHTRGASGIWLDAGAGEFAECVWWRQL